MSNSCDSCQVVMINGIRCHETGCPEMERSCKECGFLFVPGKGESRSFCSGSCQASYYGLECDGGAMRVMVGTIQELTGVGEEILVSSTGIYLARFLNGMMVADGGPVDGTTSVVDDRPTVAVDSYFVGADNAKQG